LTIELEDFGGGQRHFLLERSGPGVSVVRGPATSPGGFGAFVSPPFRLGTPRFVAAHVDGRTVLLRVGDLTFNLRDTSVLLRDQRRLLFSRSFSVIRGGETAVSVPYGTLTVPRNTKDGAGTVFEWLLAAFADRSRIEEIAQVWSQRAAGREIDAGSP